MRNVNGHSIMLQAHRGVSTDCPENTMAAFKAAVAQGYDVIELDPKFTRDNQCVILHDRTLRRTARDEKGGEVDFSIADITLDEARAYEYGSWFGEAFAGEALPLFSEVLAYAREQGMPLKIDNVIESFSPEQTDILLDLVEQADMGHLAGFTCVSPDYIARVVSRFPEAVIHYDGPVDEGRLSAVKAALKDNPLVVWLPYPNKLTSWCKTPCASPERAELVRRLGARLGLWIIEDNGELEDACARFKPDVVETTGAIKPTDCTGSI